MRGLAADANCIYTYGAFCLFLGDRGGVEVERPGVIGVIEPRALTDFVSTPKTHQGRTASSRRTTGRPAPASRAASSRQVRRGVRCTHGREHHPSNTKHHTHQSGLTYHLNPYITRRGPRHLLHVLGALQGLLLLRLPAAPRPRCVGMSYNVGLYTCHDFWGPRPVDGRPLFLVPTDSYKQGCRTCAGWWGGARCSATTRAWT